MNDQSRTTVRASYRWLRAAWRFWLVYSVLLVVLLIAGLPLFFANLQTACDGIECDRGQLTLAEIQKLQEAGIPVTLHATLVTVFVLTFDSLVGFGLALLLFLRKRDEWSALLLALPVVSHATNYPGAIPLLESTYPALLPLTRLPSFFVIAMWYPFFATFPDGRFVPRWSRWLVLVSLGVAVLVFVPGVSSDRSSLVTTIVSGWFTLVFVLALIFQAYRYWCVSDATGRQQAKWVIYGIAFSLVMLIVVIPSLNRLFPTTTAIGTAVTVYFDLISSTLFGPVAIFLSFWIAILRYRLWDIDVIINRTLVYGLLTATLTVVYLSTIISLQYLIRVFTGGTSDLAIVISTLAIAALFQPLRRRIQSAIDRRFYRRKYDAAQTLHAFSARLRDEVELNTLIDDVVSVVEETLQPVHVSVWLRGRDVKRKT